jgi:hypothetical protein
MYVWIVLLSLVLPAKATTDTADVTAEQDALRYRGIEQLLAKFDAEAVETPAPKRAR